MRESFKDRNRLIWVSRLRAIRTTSPRCLDTNEPRTPRNARIPLMSITNEANAGIIICIYIPLSSPLFHISTHLYIHTLSYPLSLSLMSYMYVLYIHSWDGVVRVWRRQLHDWDNDNPIQFPSLNPTDSLITPNNRTSKGKGLGGRGKWGAQNGGKTSNGNNFNRKSTNAPARRKPVPNGAWRTPL